MTTAPRAALSIDVPDRLRGGLLYQARFTLQARGGSVSNPKLVFGENWLDGLTLNSTTPNPSAENSRGGRIAMAFPSLGRGRSITVLTEWQVNPTTVGRRSLATAFLDGNEPLVSQRRTLTIFP